MFFPKLDDYFECLRQNLADHKPLIQAPFHELAEFIAQRINQDQTVVLVFICTHNSRRSQLSQVLAASAADAHGLVGIETFSGGTEVTACEPRALAALERLGFSVDKTTQTNNPIYHVRGQGDGRVHTLFSKRFASAPNPQAAFAAIMTCDQAADACPLVPGAALRVAFPFSDPKAADGMANEAQVYDDRTREIGFAWFFLMDLVRKKVASNSPNQ